MTHAQYISYFENIAEKHVLIQHNASGRKSFFRVNIEEYVDELSGKKVHFPCLCLDAFGVRLSGQNDSVLDVTTFAFMVLNKVKQNNFDDENTQLDECLSICKQIIARCYKDYRTRATFSDGTLKFATFDLNSVQYALVVNRGDNEMGYMVRFSAGTPATTNLGFDSSKWTDS